MYNKLDFYHGSSENFESFSEDKIGKNFDASKGFYFTNNTYHDCSITGEGIKYYEDPYSAGAYAKNSENGTPVIYICNLKINNPLTIPDLIEYYCLDKKDPFDGQHPQDFLDINKNELIEIMKREKKDSIVLDQSTYSDEKEITAIVFNNSQIEFKFRKNEIKLFLKNKNKNENKNENKSIIKNKLKK